MTRNEIALFVAPMILFGAVALAALLVAGQIRRVWESGDGSEKFQAFVEDVQNGRRVPTSDEWLDGMKRQNATAKAYHEAATTLRNLMLWLAAAAVLGMVLQVVAALQLLKRLRHQPPGRNAHFHLSDQNTEIEQPRNEGGKS
jgi:hypothetical protein